MYVLSYSLSVYWTLRLFDKIQKLEDCYKFEVMTGEKNGMEFVLCEMDTNQGKIHPTCSGANHPIQV